MHGMCHRKGVGTTSSHAKEGKMLKLHKFIVQGIGHTTQEIKPHMVWSELRKAGLQGWAIQLLIDGENVCPEGQAYTFYLEVP
jgi:hypothetical protein